MSTINVTKQDFTESAKAGIAHRAHNRERIQSMTQMAAETRPASRKKAACS